MKRESYLDIAKGIGIICVVLVHSAIMPIHITHWINQFYMPMFFAASAYMTGKRKKLETFSDLAYIISKFARMYISACTILLLTKSMLNGLSGSGLGETWNSLYSMFFGRY